uniref:Uncharacterized protein n=1 Tax=Moumouvirus sp. 'Monve' TaxID=1128131 RepID=H2ECX2_9VIRU|nr:hypothetical protein mv_L40 [Moumouvirus Monve]
MSQTLSFSIYDDLIPVVGFEKKFNNICEVGNILKNIWNIFLSGRCSDRTGYFFDKKTMKKDIKYILGELKNKNYCTFNGFEKYYVVAFSLNYTKFYIWSKDCSPVIIGWSQDGPLIDNLCYYYDR